MTFEYEIGDQVEVFSYLISDGWISATVTDRFVGPLSAEPVYVVDGDEGYYPADVRPLPQSLRVPDDAA